MSTFAEEKFRITRRIAPLQSMKSIDYITKVYVSNKQYLPASSKVRKYLKMAEDIKRNAYSSERGHKKSQKISDEGCDDETSTNSKLRDTFHLKENSESSGRFSKRIAGRQSPTTDDTLQGRQKSSTTSQINSISNHESSDSINSKGQNIEQNKIKLERWNSLPTSPTQQTGMVTSTAFSKQKLKLQSSENDSQQYEDNHKQNIQTKDITPATLEDYKCSTMSGRKNLLLQRAQLMRLDQFNKKEESDNFIKEEEEDDDDILFQGSFEKKINKFQNESETELFQENGNELSIIKQKANEQIRYPLTLQNIQRYQRNSIPSSQSGQRTRNIQNNDIASILQELDLEDSKQKIISPQNFAFNGIKKNIGGKKIIKNMDLQVSMKTNKQYTTPLIENLAQPARLLPQGAISLSNQRLQKIQSSTSTNNFYQNQHQFMTKSSNQKQRSYQQQDINQIMNQNFLQDIKDLRKKLQKQTFIMKAINI